MRVPARAPRSWTAHRIPENRCPIVWTARRLERRSIVGWWLAPRAACAGSTARPHDVAGASAGGAGGAQFLADRRGSCGGRARARYVSALRFLGSNGDPLACSCRAPSRRCGRYTGQVVCRLASFHPHTLSVGRVRGVGVQTRGEGAGVGAGAWRRCRRSVVMCAASVACVWSEEALRNTLMQPLPKTCQRAWRTHAPETHTCIALCSSDPAHRPALCS